MNKLLIGIAASVLMLMIAVPAAGARTVRVRSYYKPSTGAYVMPSYRTSPNRTRFDNYSTRGNYNPYTGKTGTRNPFK